MKKLVVLLLLVNTLLYAILLELMGKSNFQITSVIAQSLAMLIALAVLPYFNTKQVFTEVPLSKLFPVYIVLIIVFGNAVIGIFNLDYILSRISFAALNESTGMDIGKISNYTGGASIFISQSGGFFLQIFLIFFLSQLLDVEMKFKDVFRLTGIAYIGFFIISAVMYVYNLITLDTYGSLNEFNDQIKNAKINMIVGKFGEYATLCIAIYLFYKYKNLPPSKAIKLIYLPNILLMLSYVIFDKLF